VTWHCERAWLPDGVAQDVVVEADGNGAIVAVRAGTPAPADAVRLGGLVLPGFANAHSHAFHRALRGRTHGEGGTFWTWRERMYALADVLDPDSMLRLARAAYGEMVLAGFTAVGEFHYLHHQAGGRPYTDPNAMGEALRAAAAEAGIRLTLLDACYLTGGVGRTLTGPQLRFGDASSAAWAERVHRLEPDGTTRIGAAVHSVRAVPEDQLAGVAEAMPGAPLHVHLSEQPAENAECRAAYGCTPTELLDRHGVLGPRTTAVHATHLTDADIGLLGGSRTSVCLCPTTERDLADGIGPARRLHDAGARLCLGSDQHAVVDPFEEARGMEMHERLASGERGRFEPATLVDALSHGGHAALGWPDAGRIEVGATADLVAVDLGSVRTAGALPDQALFAATAGDVSDVVVGGRLVVRGGEHVLLGDVAASLGREIDAVWQAAGA
jgi:formiminoglutamate deiminase